MTPVTCNSPEDFYTSLDETCASLRELGLIEIANEIDNVVHKIMYTTGNELFERLEPVLMDLLAVPKIKMLPKDLAAELRCYLRLVSDALDKRNP